MYSTTEVILAFNAGIVFAVVVRLICDIRNELRAEDVKRAELPPPDEPDHPQ